MKIIDSVHGEIEITEPIILELVETPTMQRLKGVDQCGYFEPYFPGASHSRFSHSVGDYFLLQKFGAKLEEQIAGLLHDASHSVFSHAIDYIVDRGTEGTQTHQDDIFVEYMKETEVPEILEKHGYDPDYILNEHNFSLQETELPELCADRIDYSLRSGVEFGEITQQEAQDILNSLLVEDGKWVMSDVSSAKRYVELFKHLNEKYWSGLVTAVMFRTTADFVKHALAKDYINERDLYTTDKEVIEKINMRLEEDETLQLLAKRMNKGEGYSNSTTSCNTEVFTKSRVIDPWVKNDDSLVRYSDLFPEWKKVVEEEMKAKRYCLKFED